MIAQTVSAVPAYYLTLSGTALRDLKSDRSRDEIDRL